MPSTQELAGRLRHPGRLASAAFTRLQCQRLLGWEPPEFRRVAKDALYTGKIEGWRYRQDLQAHGGRRRSSLDDLRSNLDYAGVADEWSRTP